jgi:hypothetical protein
MYACNETNFMHYVSSVYSVTIPVHVLGLLVAHHKEVTNQEIKFMYLKKQKLNKQQYKNTSKMHDPMAEYVGSHPTVS